MLNRTVALLFVASALPLTMNAAGLNEDLEAAVRKGDAQTVGALLANGANVNAKFQDGGTALSYAVRNGHLEVVKVLLERGAGINTPDSAYGWTPLSQAAAKGHAGIVKLLLEKGAQGADEALITGASRGSIAVVKAVLDRGRMHEETLATATALAAKNGYTEIAELIKKAPPAAQPDLELLKTYAGKYKAEQGMDFSFVVSGGKLMAAPAGQELLTMQAIDRITFRPMGLEGISATFNLEDGKVVSFTMRDNAGMKMTLKKVE